MSFLVLLQPVLIWGWHFKASMIGGSPVYVFYDTNSKLVFRLSKNLGGVDDFSAKGGAIAIAWWDIEGKRRHCYVSLVGRNQQEFKRIELGECGKARMGIDSYGLNFVVLYSKPRLSKEGCIIEGWKDGKMFYIKHVGNCEAGDVFLNKSKVEYLLLKKGVVETSWNGKFECKSVVFEGEDVKCDGKKISPSKSICSF